MLPQKIYTVDPPQEIQLLQEPRLLPLQTLCHAVHFPEEEANTAVMRDSSEGVSYQDMRHHAEVGCPGLLTLEPVESGLCWKQRGLGEYGLPWGVSAICKCLQP